MDDTLKEYLIKIGIDIPMSEIQKFNAHMESFDKGVFGLVKRINNLISGWKGAVLAYAGVAKSISSFAQGVAKADMETQKFARHMYLTNDSAKILSRTLDAMDMQFSDLQDVALNPELFNQYRELVRLGKDLTGGREVDNSLKKIREVSFEFTKLKLTLNYLGERIAHYISKILDSPTGKAFVKGLKDMNAFLKNNIDTIARKVAGFMNVIMRTILRVGQVFKGIVNLIKDGYNWLESRIKGLGNAIVAILGVVGMALLLGPFGKLLLLFQAIMILVDDYMTYKEGGDYLIPWAKLEKIFDELKEFFAWFFTQMFELIEDIQDLLRIKEKKPVRPEKGIISAPKLTQQEKESGIVYKPSFIESVFRLPAEGLGRLILPKEDFKELKEKSPSFWDQASNQKPVTLVFNGNNFTREDIERGAKGNNLVVVRMNNGGIVG